MVAELDEYVAPRSPCQDQASDQAPEKPKEDDFYVHGCEPSVLRAGVWRTARRSHSERSPS